MAMLRLVSEDLSCNGLLACIIDQWQEELWDWHRRCCTHVFHDGKLLAELSPVSR